MRLLSLIVLFLLIAARAPADVLDGTRFSAGALAMAQVATGASSNSVCAGPLQTIGVPPMTVCGGGYRWSLVITYHNGSGTATVQTEVNCSGQGWIPVQGSSKALGAVANDGISIVYPQCQLRTDVTACAGCSVTTSFAMGKALP
jgi:hypothetical protein